MILLAAWIALAAPAVGPTAVAVPIEHPERIGRFLGALGGPTRVRVTQFGDSHIAADLLTAPIRAGLQARFGDGGRGFLLAGRPWSGYWQDGVTVATEGSWQVTGLRGGLDDGFVGPGGCSMAGDDPEALLTIGVGAGRPGFSTVDVHFLRQPAGGCMEVRFDGRPVQRVSTRGPWPEADFARIEAEPDTRLVTLHPMGGGEVRVFGASLDHPRGVSWDALGLNGARATRLLVADPIALGDGLRRLNPQLVVVSYGANELNDGELDMRAYAADQDHVVARLRALVPGADCLITGPSDQLRGKDSPPYSDAVYRVQREVADRHGCAFFDMRAVMGGLGSVRQWRRQGLAGRDHVHLTQRGYAILGDALLQAILVAYDARR